MLVRVPLPVHTWKQGSFTVVPSHASSAGQSGSPDHSSFVPVTCSEPVATVDVEVQTDTLDTSVTVTAATDSSHLRVSLLRWIVVVTRLVDDVETRSQLGFALPERSSTIRAPLERTTG